MPEWIGKTIGKVRIDKYLARGGMAEVYLGTHLSLDRPVAVKVLHSFIESEPDLLGRFQREAKAVAGLRHPNIVQIYDFDTYDGHPYIVMEYLPGPSLSTYLQNLHKSGKKLPLEQVGQLLKSIAAGVDYAHSQGIIHRDIKPANIILRSRLSDFSIDSPLTKDVEAVITDFGLARITHAGTQTASGLVSGTPAYMAPEQARGENVDKRADNYSIGIMLYEMLSGKVPFEGDSSIAVIMKQINDPPPPISDLSAELQAVVKKALSKTPDERYQDGHDIVSDYYRAVGLHGGTETIRLTQPNIPAPTVISHPSEKKPKNNNWILIGGGVFVCLCLALLLVGGLIGGMFVFPQSKSTPIAVMPTTAGPTSTSVVMNTEPPPATTEVPIPSSTPIPTKTLLPEATPTLMVLPQTWGGTYNQTGVGTLSITLIIERMNGNAFTGKMVWKGTNTFRGATTKVSGQFVKDFGDATEQAKWGNHPDYKSGDRSGIWIKWTEVGFVKGGGYTLGGWYYGHIRDAKTMTGIYYLNLDISSFASNDTWQLTKK